MRHRGILDSCKIAILYEIDQADMKDIFSEREIAIAILSEEK